jgi:hypothetical protein
MQPKTEARRILVREELTRVDGHDPASLPPIAKHTKMAGDPLSFLRGAPQLFYADVKNGTLVLPTALVDGVPLTTILGDCHFSNFGLLTEEGSHGDNVIFSPNDFDDACIGPAGWDLARFCVSVLLAAEYCRGVLDGRYAPAGQHDKARLEAPAEGESARAAKAFLKAYVRTCEAIVDDPAVRMTVVSGFRKGHVLATPYSKAVRRTAGGKDFETRSSLGEAVELASGRLRFRDRPDRYKRLEPAHAAAVKAVFRPYVNDTVLDIVQRIGAGTGSLNLDRYYLLVGPGDFSGPADLPLCQVVEIKQQRSAAALFHFPNLSPVNRLNPAHLTVACQRLVQRRPDPVLDEVPWDGAHWLVRSRHHARVGIAPEDVCLARKAPGKRLKQYAAACGEALALAHARGDRRSTRFEAAMVKALGDSADLLVQTAREYAGQTVRDCELLKAIAGETG